MFSLQELKDCWQSLEYIMESGHHELEPDERKALDLSCKMIAAIVVQLESQSISFTP